MNNSENPNKLDAEEILKLAEEIRKRGNRLEIMNGKVYEVKRTLIGEIKE